MPKNVQTTKQQLILHASKVMVKILQAKLQQLVNCELPDFQAGFRKGRGTRGLIANICWIIIKAKEFQKTHLNLFYWLCQSLWLCGSQQTVENSSRDGNTRPPYLPPEKSVCRSRSNSSNWTWNNRLVPNGERSKSMLYIVTCLFNLYAEYIMRNFRLDEAQAGIKIAGRNIHNLTYTDNTPLGQKAKN